MSYFAVIENGIVVNVIKSDGDFIKTLNVTCEETFKGGSEKYAGIGYSFDKDLKSFVSPKPFSKWVLDPEKKDWVAPVEKTSDDQRWDDSKETWVKAEIALVAQEEIILKSFDTNR